MKMLTHTQSLTQSLKKSYLLGEQKQCWIQLALAPLAHHHPHQKHEVSVSSLDGTAFYRNISVIKIKIQPPLKKTTYIISN